MKLLMKANLKKDDVIKNTKKGTLKKKPGLDKLIITLVLMAVGVGLCVIYRNSIYSTMTTAFNTLSSKINDLMQGAVSNS